MLGLVLLGPYIFVSELIPNEKKISADSLQNSGVWKSHSRNEQGE